MSLWRWGIMTRWSDGWESSLIKAPGCGCKIKVQYLPKDEAESKRKQIYDFHASKTHRDAAESLLMRAAQTQSNDYLEAFAQSLEMLNGSSPTDAYLDALVFVNEAKRWVHDDV